jgi:hypothetical protein
VQACVSRNRGRGLGLRGRDGGLGQQLRRSGHAIDQRCRKRADTANKAGRAMPLCIDQWRTRTSHCIMPQHPANPLVRRLS